MKVTVIGAGLAGSECAWQLAQRGIQVRLCEMKPEKMTPAHTTEYFAELCCSNSLRGAALENAVGLLKEELRRLQKDGCLTIYDEPFNGRNRRYYKITPLGRQQLAGYKAEWKVYAANIDHIFGEDAK